MKCVWLKEGGRNTRFFHAMAINRRRTNMVSKIRDEKGYKNEKEEDISRVFLNYFKEVYSTSIPKDMEMIF